MRKRTEGELEGEKEKKSALPWLEEIGLESSEAHPQLAVPTPPPPQRRSWAELTAEGSGPGSTLLPRLPQSHSAQPQPLRRSPSLTSSSPATEATPYTAAENQAARAAPGREVSSTRHAPRARRHATVFFAPRLALASLGPTLGPKAGLSPNTPPPIGYWSPGIDSLSSWEM